MDSVDLSDRLEDAVHDAGEQQAERGLAHGQLGVVRNEHEIAGQRELEAGSDGVTLDEGDGDLRYAMPPREGRLRLLDEAIHLVVAAGRQLPRHLDVPLERDGRALLALEQASDAAQVRESGAEGVGLFRTEYLFINRETTPTEEQQYEDYRAAAAALKLRLAAGSRRSMRAARPRIHPSRHGRPPQPARAARPGFRRPRS